MIPFVFFAELFFINFFFFIFESVNLTNFAISWEKLVQILNIKKLAQKKKKKNPTNDLIFILLKNITNDPISTW
jgi:hypothetical protein